MAKKSLVLALSVAAMALPSAPALAAVSVNVRTGQGAKGTRDINWLVSGGAIQGGPIQAYIPETVNGSWVGGSANTPTADGAKWITPVTPGTSTVPAGAYIYSTSFTLPDITQLANLIISGKFWVDNQVTSIVLNETTTIFNGALPGNTFSGAGVDFSSTTGFRTGVNNLVFNVSNFSGSGANPTGLRVAALTTAAAVPEPGTWMLLLLGFGAIGFSMRFRQKSQGGVQFA